MDELVEGSFEQCSLYPENGDFPVRSGYERHLGGATLVLVESPRLAFKELIDDEEYLAELAVLLDPNGPEITESDQRPRRHDGWTPEDRTEYIRFLLVDVLRLNPEVDRVSISPILHCASLLGLGPTERTFRDSDGKQNTQEIVRQLGFTPEINKAEPTMSAPEIRARSRQYFRNTGKRPTYAIISRWGAKHGFDPQTVVEKYFGSLRTLHELIGAPSFRGATSEDLIDWGAAFKHQHPDVVLSNALVAHFSSMNRGPSRKAIVSSGNFTDMTAYVAAVEEEFSMLQEAEDLRREARLSDVKKTVEAGHMPHDVINDASPQETLRKSAVYILVLSATEGNRNLAQRHLTYDNLPQTMSMLAQGDPDRLAYLELLAQEHMIFEDLWPGYRYDNVDFILPDAA